MTRLRQRMLEDLRPGGYRVHASRDGYRDTMVKGVKVEAGKQAAIEVELHPAATIHLRVTDSAGLPIAGKILFVYAGGTPPMGRGLYLDLDEDGRGKGSVKREIEPGENTLAVHIERE